MKQSTLHNEKIAIMLSFIPGLGQIYNHQKTKGILFVMIFLLEIIEITFWGSSAVSGLITLGKVPMEDHSLFLLIEGTMQIIIFSLMICFHLYNLHDAKVVAGQLKMGKKVSQNRNEMISNLVENGFSYLLVIPAYLLMLFVIVFPVLVTIFIAFTNYDFKHIPPYRLIEWVGAKNFINILQLSTFRNAFSSVFTWTVIWTFFATSLQIIIGVFTALVMNQKFVKFKRIFGVIFLLPWAVPAFVSIMSFSNYFNDSIGAMNLQVIPLIEKIFPFFSFELIPWKTDPFWSKIAIILIQAWLGFPYIYILTTGILQSIPNELYEAATVDGANRNQKFWKITCPMILAVSSPTFITQYTFNFNNFSVIYLFNNGGPGSIGGGAGSTDILISWIYKLTTQNSPQFSMASAVTLVISLLIIMVSLISFRKFNSFNMGGN